MKRLLWLGIGIGVGALVVRAVSKRARSYTPAGLAAGVRDTGRNLLDAARDFVDDVREGMHEREEELAAAFLEGDPGYPGHPGDAADQPDPTLPPVEREEASR